jgi:hypothetical protein
MQRSDIEELIRVDRQRRFIRAMSKAIEGQPVTQSERALLNAIFEALLRGDDVSGLTGTRSPHIRRSSDRIDIALHYLCLTRLLNEKAAAAWQTVGEAWELRKCDVQKIVADHRMPAVAMLRQFAAAPDKLLRRCERHAWAARHGRRRSVPVPGSVTREVPRQIRLP